MSSPGLPRSAAVRRNARRRLSVLVATDALLTAGVASPGPRGRETRPLHRRRRGFHHRLHRSLLQSESYLRMNMSKAASNVCPEAAMWALIAELSAQDGELVA